MALAASVGGWPGRMPLDRDRYPALRSITCYCVLRQWPDARPRPTLFPLHPEYSIWLPQNASDFFSRPRPLMAVQSTLRPSKERVAQLVAAYAKHRPLVQRALTASFVIYVISTTYKSLAARPPSTSSAPSKRKGKGKEGDGAVKPARVAVSLHIPSKFGACSNGAPLRR